MAHRLKQRRLLAGLLAQIFSAFLTSIQKSEYGSQQSDCPPKYGSQQLSVKDENVDFG